MFVFCDATLPDISEVQAETSVNHRTKKPCCSVVAVFMTACIFFSRKNPAYYPKLKGEGACFLTTQICPTLARLPNCFTICLFMGGRACTDVCVCACVFFQVFHFSFGSFLEQISSKEEITLQQFRCCYQKGSYPNEKERFCLNTVCREAQKWALVLLFSYE